MTDAEAIALALAEAKAAGARGEVPVGAVLTSADGQILARDGNRILERRDPTAHAEVVAIRAACAKLAAFQLDGCDLYTTCEPCPMCLGAIYWARPERVVYAATRQQAAAASSSMATR